MNRLISSLLGVSMAFNMAFAGGYFTAGTTTQVEKKEGPEEKLVESLKLDEAQQKELDAIKGEESDRATELREQIVLTRKTLLSQLSQAEVDPDEVATTRQQLDEQMKEYRELAVAKLQQFMEVLTPEQRERLTGRFHRRGPFRHDHRRLLEQFDTNKDGELDEAERRKAREEMKARAEAHHKRMLEKYDADDNGKIEGEELRAIYRDKFDRNQDGKLDEEELRRAWLHHGAMMDPAMRKRLMNRYDKNQDGELDDAEKAEMRREMWKRFSKSRGPGRDRRGPEDDRDREHDRRRDDPHGRRPPPPEHR